MKYRGVCPEEEMEIFAYVNTVRFFLKSQCTRAAFFNNLLVCLQMQHIGKGPKFDEPPPSGGAGAGIQF